MIRRYLLQGGVCAGGGEGGGQIRLSFFSLLYGTPSNISRKPATEGMDAQHLRTFERVPANKELLTGTVLVSNIFLIF